MDALREKLAAVIARLDCEWKRQQVIQGAHNATCICGNCTLSLLDIIPWSHKAHHFYNGSLFVGVRGYQSLLKYVWYLRIVAGANKNCLPWSIGDGMSDDFQLFLFEPIHFTAILVTSGFFCPPQG